MGALGHSCSYSLDDGQGIHACGTWDDIHTRTYCSSLLYVSSLLFHFNLQLSTSRPPLFSFRGWDEFILSDTGEESEWMDWLTFLMICRHLHLRWLRVQHALVFYMLLPVRMTSWVVHNLVTSTRFATSRISWSSDIHVWLPSQRHPSRCYVLHLDTWGSLYTIS